MYDQPSASEIGNREDYIRGRPPRMPALPAEQRTERQKALLDDMSMVVVDGVRKARETMASLEILIRHAELYKAHIRICGNRPPRCPWTAYGRSLMAAL